MSSSIGEQFWAPKTMPVRPAPAAARTSAAVRTGWISAPKASKRRFHATIRSTVSRKSSQ